MKMTVIYMMKKTLQTSWKRVESKMKITRNKLLESEVDIKNAETKHEKKKVMRNISA